MKVKVGLVQINTSFYGQDHLPLALGLLQAYARKNLESINDFEFSIPVSKRTSVKEAVNKLSGNQIVFFSIYDWSFVISLEIAKELKKLDPKVFIVIGGPGISYLEVKEILEKNPQVALACLGNGEQTFTEILRNYQKKNWEEIKGVSFFRDNVFFNGGEAERIFDLDSLPSPYLDNLFEPIIESDKKTKWIALWETNRGCQYQCTYCAWGRASHRKISHFSLERLFKEIDWMAEHKIQFITCCDSNFGTYERDYEIAKYIAESKARTGYPEGISIQTTKQFNKNAYNIYKVLYDAKLNSSITLSLQSTHEPTLIAIKRNNMNLETFKKAEETLSGLGIKSFTDLILGLPEETYDSWANGISEVIAHGQHDRITFQDLSVLANAELGEKEYQEKYGLDIIENAIVNRHGSILNTDIQEREKLVVATNTMTREEWIKAKAFASTSSLLHYNKLLQIPFVILHEQYGFTYRELIEIFFEGELPKFFQDIKNFFINKARDVQNGETPHCEAKEWLGIWWPPDEYKFIDIIRNENIDVFYTIAEIMIAKFLSAKGIENYKDILHECIILNRAILKLPFRKIDEKLNLSYNIYRAYREVLKGNRELLKRGSFPVKIPASKENWDTWESWYEKLVFIQYKKGTYIYECEML